VNPVRVLIVPDKFKGTLTAQSAAEAIARGWRKARPDDALELLPMSDGGDGFGEVMASLLGAKVQKTMTMDAAHRPLNAKWWWVEETKTALIESAQVIGLALLPPGKFHPFELDTFGLGKVFEAAKRRGATNVLIGIGGSATNDGGFGLARSLGWKFFDAGGSEVQRWTDLCDVKTVRRPKLKNFPRVTVAVDVRNPLLGARGATRVYGMQKGLRAKDFKPAESCLRRLALLCGRFRQAQNLASVCGAGAAGGLGFGLKTFLNAKLEPGFDIFSKTATLPKRIRSLDLVITGEGAIDEQTFMGKGVGEIFKMCSELGVRCIGFAGVTSKLKKQFEIHALTEVANVNDAKADAARWLQQLAHQVAFKLREPKT
jgi:glycerate 2-kinase